MHWEQLPTIWMEASTESSLGVGDTTVEACHPLTSHCLHHPHNQMVGVEADLELVLVQEELEEQEGRSFLFEINNIRIFCGGTYGSRPSR